MGCLVFRKMEKEVSAKHPLMISERPNRIATHDKKFFTKGKKNSLKNWRHDKKKDAKITKIYF